MLTNEDGETTSHLMGMFYRTLRIIDNKEMEWYMEDCLLLKKEFPHLIAGKLVQDSDLGQQKPVYSQDSIWSAKKTLGSH